MLGNDYKISTYSNSSNIDLKLFYSGTQQCPPGHSWGPALKDHYKIHYIHSGKGIFRTINQTYTLSSGQGFLIYPDQISSYAADEADPWTYSWVAFQGASAEYCAANAILSVEQPVFTCEQDDVIRSCIRQMYEASQLIHASSRDLRLTAALCSFLAVIMDSVGSNVQFKRFDSGKDVYVSRILAYTETNYSRSLRIEDLANELGLTRKYMSSLFKEAVGISPQQYVFQYRLNKARELLKKASLSIREVAYSVGYHDQLLFSRMFKKTFGMSPSEYRNNEYDKMDLLKGNTHEGTRE
ncbi:AraC family transcriptional regulator [Paenibacillus prosopidis]|uniref:AraC-like DNA-binding protein n=1 Tax=Paenibacillus prosopidis TaxID=630520 RepID=A0A368VZF7_9BACL|nr:AraC family transcriptional regulator [Paenibacillus prosopidis]RCW47395.1 AraC-like DNA-binding protein [Paenibacillus prosopidis]